MKALVLSAIGQPFEYKEVPNPSPKAGEVIIDIHAAALNHRDLWIQKGQYAHIQLPIILGSDGAGIVSEIGAGVDSSWKGSEVILNPSMGWSDPLWSNSPEFRILGMPDNGTFAEKVCISAAQLAAKPKHLDFDQSAALPLAGLTAYRAVFTRGQLKKGEMVLITGVGGGVALFAFQFALAAGAEVYVTSGSEEKLEQVRLLGAIDGAIYRNPDWENTLKSALKSRGARGFDLIIDSAGGPGFQSLVELAAPGGRIVFFGATAGDPPAMPQRRIFWKQLSIIGSTMGSPKDFRSMTAFVDQHQLKPFGTLHQFALSEGNNAFAAMDQGSQFGKILLKLR